MSCTFEKKIIVVVWLVLFCILYSSIYICADVTTASVNQLPIVNFKLPVVKDTSISSVGRERVGNNGRGSRLKLKSIQEYILFDVDIAQLEGLLIKNAWLNFRSASPVKAPVKRVGVSTLACDWIEGKLKGFKSETGVSCFVQAEFDKKDWAYPGSTLMDVVFGRGNTIWHSSETVVPDRDEWQKSRIDSDVVAARVAGISRGFCLYDDVGSEWKIDHGEFKYYTFPNRTIYSSESFKSSPWLEVEIEGKDLIPPDTVKSIKVENKELPFGEVFLFWETPRDQGGGKTLGFDVSWKDGKNSGKFPRYLIPMAGKPGEVVMMHIQDMNFSGRDNIEVTVVSVDSAGNRSSPFLKSLSLSKGLGTVDVAGFDIKPFSGGSKLPSVGGIEVSVIDLLDKYIPKKGRMIPEHDKGYRSGNHIFSGKDRVVRLEGAKNEDVCFQINIEGENRDLSIECIFDNFPDIKPVFYKFEYVEGMPDPLVSVNDIDGIAFKGIGSYLCEIYIPHGTEAGIKKGKFVVSAGKERVEFDVNLTVWDFTLPDRLSFIPEMNAYSRVSPYKGYKYYRLAHRHRTCLNRLPYGWNGLPEFAPVKAGKGFDWDKWDTKVGPLVDGSAFADLPRKNQPVDIFYLPLSENWPVKLDGNYKKSWWADEALSDSYKEGLKGAFKDFTVHIKDKGWDNTQFQFYLNNKVYYKKRLKDASAPWLFDEPVNIQDFMALKWYGELWHEAVDLVKGNTNSVFRCDISYTQYGRDILWGISDIEYLGGNNHQKTRMKHDEFILNKKAKFVEYGTANKISDSNLQPVLWQISAWTKGASGVLPWQTIGSENCWKTAEQTALFYPKGDEVYPSVRLKAFRYGQQFVEYLEMLGDVLGVPDGAIKKWVVKRLDMEGHMFKNAEHDAGTLTFDNVSMTDLWRLRYEIGETISNTK